MANPYVQLATAISRLAEVIFATREDAYNRKKDKKQEKAIAAGEKGVELLSEVFTYLYFKKVNDTKIQEFKKRYLKIKKRFNEND